MATGVAPGGGVGSTTSSDATVPSPSTVGSTARLAARPEASTSGASTVSGSAINPAAVWAMDAKSLTAGVTPSA